MVNLDITYEGDLRCSAVHGPSSNQLTTDAPLDNHGLGQAFSPTDLVGTALGSCLLTVMGIAARARQVDLKGTTVHVVKEMTVERPRRIARLTVEVTFPPQIAVAIPDTTRRDLEHIAETCPVRLSISDKIEVPMSFNWQL
jgi:putative redox protein